MLLSHLVLFIKLCKLSRPLLRLLFGLASSLFLTLKLLLHLGNLSLGYGKVFFCILRRLMCFSRCRLSNRLILNLLLLIHGRIFHLLLIFLFLFVSFGLFCRIALFIVDISRCSLILRVRGTLLVRHLTYNRLWCRLLLCLGLGCLGLSCRSLLLIDHLWLTIIIGLLLLLLLRFALTRLFRGLRWSLSCHLLLMLFLGFGGRRPRSIGILFFSTSLVIFTWSCSLFLFLLSLLFLLLTLLELFGL